MLSHKQEEIRSSTSWGEGNRARTGKSRKNKGSIYLKKKKSKYLLNTMMSSSTCAEVSILGCGTHLCQHLKLHLSVMVDKRNNSLLHRFSAG